MVLFLFVIMLLNLKDEHELIKFDARRGASFLIGVAFIAEMMFVFRSFFDDPVTGEFKFGSVEPIGRQLMTNYLFPFEIISVILLAALIGAIVIARKHTYTD